MKPRSMKSAYWLITSLLLGGFTLALISWDRKHDQNDQQFKQDYQDTPKKKNNVVRDKKVRDLDEALEELDNVNMGEISAQVAKEIAEAMKNIDATKLQQEISAAMKSVDMEKIMKEVDVAKIQKEVAEAMKSVDMAKIQKEITESMSKIDMEKIKAEIDAAKKINMEEPNCHTDKKMSIHNAAVGLPNHLTIGIPRESRRILTIPKSPKTLRHIIATATLPPISEGKQNNERYSPTAFDAVFNNKAINNANASRKGTPANTQISVTFNDCQ